MLASISWKKCLRLFPGIELQTGKENDLWLTK